MGNSILNKFKKKIEINFTDNGNFAEFNNVLKKYLRKNKSKKIAYIIDYIYPLTRLAQAAYKIKDHINLSGYNPLAGPNFISLTNTYILETGIIVVGIKKGVELSNKEKKILLKCGVKAYCYNLVPTAVFCKSLGSRIKAIGVVKKPRKLLAGMI